MADVNRVMEQINRHCEQAHIIMGAAIDDALMGALTVTLVAARRGNAECGMRSAESSSVPAAPDFGGTIDEAANSPRSASRFVAPPPPSTPETTGQLMKQQGGGARGRKNASRLRQGTLSLEIISKGRFEKSEPTIYLGQDLDVPTYIRRGVALN